MPNVTILKDRLTEFKEFIINDKEIDSFSLIESDKFKTTVISLGNLSGFTNMTTVENYEKKYKNFKINVFPDYRYQTANMLSRKRDMDYVLGVRPDFVRSGLKEDDFITLIGKKDPSVDFDITKEHTWKNYMLLWNWSCGIHPTVLKNWDKIKSIIESLRTDRTYMDTYIKKFREMSVSEYQEWLKTHKMAIEKGFYDLYPEFGLKAIMKNVDEGFFCYEKTKSNPMVCKASKDKK